MIKRIKLSDRILLGAIAALFAAGTVALIWLRLNWECIFSLVQIVH